MTFSIAVKRLPSSGISEIFDRATNQHRVRVLYSVHAHQAAFSTFFSFIFFSFPFFFGEEADVNTLFLMRLPRSTEAFVLCGCRLVVPLHGSHRHTTMMVESLPIVFPYLYFPHSVSLLPSSFPPFPLLPSPFQPTSSTRENRLQSTKT